MNRQRKAAWMLASSMAVFGTLGIFTRRIGVSSGELALYRAILAVVVVGAYMAASRTAVRLRSVRKELPLLALSGAAMGFNWILLFQAYKYTTISAATLSYYFAPVIVTAVCPILFRERLTRKQMLCFAMSTVGLVLIIGTSGLLKGGSDLTGILFGLGAAVLYAAVILLNKFIRGVDGIQRTLIQLCAAIAVLAPYVLCTGGCTLAALDTPGWVCLLIVGLVHTGVTYCLYFSALKDLPGQEAAILSYVDPLVAVLVSVLLLGEPLTPMQGLGGALILGFTLYNELPAGAKC